MTKKLEQTLNLPPLDSFDDDLPVTPEEEELISESTDILNSLESAEKVDHALSIVSGLSEHDKEMDDIAGRALKTYEDLCGLGLNVHDAHASKIYEVAATMLKTALDAKDAKVNRKLKTIDLQLKKAKLDQDKRLKSGELEGSEGTGNMFDRNELLAHLKESVSEIEEIEEIDSTEDNDK